MSQKKTHWIKKKKFMTLIFTKIKLRFSVSLEWAAIISQKLANIAIINRHREFVCTFM